MKNKQVLALLLMTPSLLYDASPIDIIPDAIPVLGQADDVAFTFANLIIVIILLFVFSMLQKGWNQVDQ